MSPGNALILVGLVYQAGAVIAIIVNGGFLMVHGFFALFGFCVRLAGYIVRNEERREEERKPAKRVDYSRPHLAGRAANLPLEEQPPGAHFVWFMMYSGILPDGVTPEYVERLRAELKDATDEDAHEIRIKLYLAEHGYTEKQYETLKQSIKDFHQAVRDAALTVPEAAAFRQVADAMNEKRS